MQTLNKTIMPDNFVMADRALFGCISRVDIDNSTPFSDRFVFNKALELPESPFMYPFVVLSSPSNVAYVLHNNRTSLTYTINNIPANVVVYPRHKPFPSATYFFKLSLGRLCAFGLELAHKLISLDPQPHNFVTIKLVVRSYSKMIYSDINSKNSFMEVRAFGTDVFRECEKEETPALFINSQETFLNIPTEIFSVTIRDTERQFNSTFDCSEAQDVIFEGGTSWEIIPYGNVLDYWFGFSLFDHPAGLLDTSNSELTLQPHRFKFFIDKRMKLDVIPNLFIPSSVDTELQSFRINLESLNYLRSCTDFDFGSCSNFHINSKKEVIYKYYASPPTAKAVGIRSGGVL
jgi:hypothetical protein